MKKELPDCICGANNWQSHGGAMGELYQSGFRCKSCPRESMQISASGGNLFMIASMSRIRDVVFDWFNDVVLPTWRANCITGVPQYGERVPVPPRIPGDDVVVWINRVSTSGSSWERVCAADTQNLPIPTDPIRLRHDEVFGRILDAVGIPAHKRVVIPNQYYKDTRNKEPWYRIELGSVVFIVGPRKRVIQSELGRKDGEPFDTGSTPFGHTLLDEVAKRDATTHTSDPFRIIIHAWDSDKAVEYLNILMDASVPVLDRMSEIQ